VLHRVMTTQVPLTQRRATLETMTTPRNSAFSDRNLGEEPRDDTTGSYALEERGALRRIAGLSTELADVTEVEYRQLRLERVVLVGVWTEGTQTDADRSLVELAALAETAGSEVLQAVSQRRDKPDAATYVGSGKDPQGQGRRPDGADPGHLRPAREQPGGQGPGRAGSDAVHAAAAARLG
jgi:GTP-binding protein HflX